MSETKRIGVVALARPTFDVPFAEEVAAEAFYALDGLGVDTVGPRTLLFDAAEAEVALETLKAEPLDLLLILQVTFTDATMTVALARAIDAPVAIWAFPEPRTGGRLRLNSLCGLNLAGHALGRADASTAYVFGRADDAAALQGLRTLIDGTLPSESTSRDSSDGEAVADPAAAEKVMAALADRRIGVVGRHPDDFDTCRYDADALAGLTGIGVEQIELPELFDRARAIDEEEVADIRGRSDAALGNLDEMEPEPLDKSLRVYAALKGLAADKGLSGLAVRCWPEMFTDYGCAACGPMAMMNQERVPCACEADVYGNASTLILQALADAPVFMADLVDLDRDSDTGVFWHCGLAPLEMADPEATPHATIHSNRRKPLLNELPLKPGRITIARLSQARNETRLVIGGAEMERAAQSFSGTSGVVRFDRPMDRVLETVMEEGLEHHYAFAYGDHRPGLRALAERMGIPVLTLC